MKVNVRTITVGECLRECSEIKVMNLHKNLLPIPPPAFIIKKEKNIEDSLNFINYYRTFFLFSQV